MKKILVLLVVFLSFSLTNCDRSEKSELSNVTAATKLSDSPSLKGGKNKSDYRAVLDKEFTKLWTKLEKKARDKRKGSGDISLTAAAPGSGDPIPPSEIWEELDEPTKAEFIEDMKPASTSLVENEFQEDCSQAPNTNIVLAALIADYLFAATDDGYAFEHISPATYALYVPPGVSADDPQNSVLVKCILQAIVNMSAILGAATTATSIATIATKKTLTFAAIKEVIKSVLASTAITAELTGPQVALIIGGAALSTITFETLACMASHIIWGAE